MAAVSSAWEPMGMEMEMDTCPWSMSGIRTVLVEKSVREKTTTNPTETSMPALRW